MKNIKVSKRLLSMISAGMLMATPVMANSESVNEDNYNDDFSLVMQVKESNPMTEEEFSFGCKFAYNYLKQYINYDGMQQDLQCLYYLVNREFIPADVEEYLINEGFVFETDIAKGDYRTFTNAYNLINVVADYNQSTIRYVDTADKIIDVSNLCYSEDDRNLVHDMHMNYFNAYKAGRFDNEYYQMVFKQLTTLNAYEHAGNASELSVGARWLAHNSIGGGVMQMLRDDMQEDFTRQELDQYFDPAELNMGQWILRNDISLDLNCLKSELECEVFDFGQLWHFIYDTVNNDILKTFEVDCTKRK